MSLFGSSRLEDHPDGGLDLNPIINGNWKKLNNWINPAFGLFCRQDDGSPPGAGTVLTASANIFRADDAGGGVLIIFADRSIAEINTVSSGTIASAFDSKEVGTQSFEIYRTTQTERTALIRGLTKRVRLVAADDKKVLRWDDTLGYCDLVNQPGFGFATGQIMFGAGTGADATSSADLKFDDTLDILDIVGRVRATKHFDTGVAAISSSASITLDFNQEQWRDINTLAHNVTFSSSNLAAGRSLQVRIVADASIRTLTFPGGWIFVGGAAPANIAATKTGLLKLWSYGTTDADVVAEWIVQP